MLNSNVLFQIAFLGRTETTIRAAVGLFPRVSSEVSLAVRFLGELFAAKFTLVNLSSLPERRNGGDDAGKRWNQR